MRSRASRIDRRSRVIEAVLQLVTARNNLLRGRRRVFALIAALTTFAVASIVALRALPEAARSPEWHLLTLVAIIGVPAAILLNGAEYAISARVLGHTVGVGGAVRISVLASAANLLPVPGSVLVRVGALTRLGTGVRPAVSATAAVGVGWIGTGSLMTGGFLAFNDLRAVGGAVALTGVLLIGLAYALVPGGHGHKARAVVLAQITMVEASSVVVKAARYWFVFRAFGVDLDAQQAVALAMAAVLATAVGFFPSGLGLQEVLSALIGPLVGQTASVSVLASSVDRIISLVVLAAVTTALLRWTRPVPGEPEQIGLAEAVELGP